MKHLFIVCLVLVKAMSSCNTSEVADTTGTNPLKAARAIKAADSTVTVVYLTGTEAEVFRVGDTINVDNFGRTADNGTKVILQSRNK